MTNLSESSPPPGNGVISPGAGADSQSRVISTVETLKALADPTRLKLLSALMAGPANELPVMSVKEMAAEIDEPQTKLYRHVKQLESAGLIRAVSSRLVSGIVEQRYQACQSDLVFGPNLTEDERSSAGLEAAVAAALELYRTRFFAAQRKGQISTSAAPDTPPHQRVILSMTEEQVPASLAATIIERLQDVKDLIDAAAAAPDNGTPRVPVNLLIGYFSPKPPPSGP